MSKTRGRAATPAYGVEKEVLGRYARGAKKGEPGLCCPAEYETRYVELLPGEIVERDYGCGDPTPHVGEGETVLDLGSGAGKICYILSQKVGPKGAVIGVDFNDEMLSLARKYLEEMGLKLGYRNVRFSKARIQDLALDLDRAQAWLDARPVRTVAELGEFEAECERLRREEPLIPNESVDVVVSNCVLNLVRPGDKERLFREIHRVLRRGGRAVISDIVCDEDPTPSIMADPRRWSDCIAGAFREDLFLHMFERAGFYGIEVLSRQEEPWQVLEGIEFRPMTVRAFKGKEGPCLERNQAVVYRGPWKSVCDDDGHAFARGRRTAVCDKTFSIMTHPAGPYGRDIVGVPPREEVPPEDAAVFDCGRPTDRHPRETKGLGYRETAEPPDRPCCGPEGCA